MLHLSNLTLSPESDNIEEMKIRFCLVLSLLFIIGLSSCASVPASGEGAAPAVQDSHKEKKQNRKKLLFDDWKYKGFGQALPVWFEAAYNDDEEKLAKALPQLTGHKLLVIRGEGVNSDQADKVLKIKEEEIPSGYILYDSSWALFRKGKSGTYIAIAVFYN